MKKIFRLSFQIFFTLVFSACDLQDFDLSKFTPADNLTPMVYIPISSGDYLVKDYTAIPETGFTPVITPQINFKPITYDLSGLTYNIKSVKTLFIAVKTINANPMQFQYSMSFKGLAMDSIAMDSVVFSSGILAGGTLDAAGHVIEPSEKTIEYFLNNSDFNKFNQATSMKLSITLIQPKIGPVIANDLKTGKITMKVAFKAPLNILKL